MVFGRRLLMELGCYQPRRHHTHFCTVCALDDTDEKFVFLARDDLAFGGAIERQFAECGNRAVRRPPMTYTLRRRVGGKSANGQSSQRESSPPASFRLPAHRRQHRCDDDARVLLP
jgi:hypothetical protein